MSDKLFNADEIAAAQSANAPAITEKPAKNSANSATDGAKYSAKAEPVTPGNRELREGKAVADGLNEAVRTIWGQDLGLSEAQKSAMQDMFADLIATVKVRLPWGASVAVTFLLMALPIALPGLLKAWKDKKSASVSQSTTKTPNGVTVNG